MGFTTRVIKYNFINDIICTLYYDKCSCSSLVRFQMVYIKGLLCITDGKDQGTVVHWCIFKGNAEGIRGFEMIHYHLIET